MKNGSENLLDIRKENEDTAADMTEEKSFKDLDEDKKEELDRFFKNMVQSLLRIGYYDPEHPESMKIKTGLFDQFRDYLADQYDLTFIAQVSELKSEVLLTGIMAEPVKLDEVVTGSTANVYTVKLAEYMGRKNLVSLTLKRELTEEEFRDFVEILSQTTVEDIQDLKGAMDRFTQALRDKGITHVSYLFDRDVVGLDRGLNWRVWLSVSRLKKDLKLIPILRKLSAEEFKVVRKQVFTEVVRPIEKPELLAELLMNCDLIETEGMGVEEVEAEIEENIPGDLVADTCLELLNWIPGSGQEEDRTIQLGDDLRARSIIRRFYIRMPEERAIQATELWERLYRQKVLNLEDLPEQFQFRIYTERRLEKFLGDPEGAVQRFDATEDWESYFKYVQLFWRIVPELLRKEKYSQAQCVLETINRHCGQGGVREEWAKAAREAIASSSAYVGLNKVLSSGDKEKRTEVTRVVLELGNWGQAILMEVIRKTEDQWALKNACNAMVSFGQEAISYLVMELEDRNIPELSYRTVIATIGDAYKEKKGHDVPSRRLVDILRKFLRYRDPLIREEVITTLAKVGDPGAGDDVIGALEDPDIRVRRKAVWCLGMLRLLKVLPDLLELLLTKKSGEEIETLKKEVCVALTLFGNVKVDEARTVEDVLCEALKRNRGNDLGRLFKGRAGKSDGVLIALCRTLGAIGTSKSKEPLKALVKGKSTALKEEAQKALNLIRDRDEVS